MFSYDNITKPESIGIEQLEELVTGSIVSYLTIEYGIKGRRFEQMPLVRCPSNYGYSESPIDSRITYVVSSVNYDPTLFRMTGLRAITLRDITIPEGNHFETWVITTDGYIRESEEYGIIGYVKEIVFEDEENECLLQVTASDDEEEFVEVTTESESDDE